MFVVFYITILVQIISCGALRIQSSLPSLKRIVGVVFVSSSLYTQPTITHSEGNPPVEQIFGLKKDRLLKCKVSSNCISTSSIESLEKYGRPWSFSKDIDDEFDDIVAVLKSTQFVNVVEANKDKYYIHAEAKSAVPPSGVDDIEFLLNKLDKIIAYRTNSRELVYAGYTMVGDGGSNKNRLEVLLLNKLQS